MPACIQRDFSTTDLDIVSVKGASFDKHYVTIHPGGEGYVDRMVQLFADFVRTRDARPVQQDVFGPPRVRTQVDEKLRAAGLPVGEWPMTWINANGVDQPALTGTQIYAVSRTVPRPVIVDGRTIGSVMESDDAVYCLLGNLLPADIDTSAGVQTTAVFELMEKALVSVDMDFGHVVRTWFYMDHILDWYDEFNEARTRFFKERKVFGNLVPASTGVGGSNSGGAALVADAIAIFPKNDSVRIHAVPSPLQCPALDYDSSFSRAVEVQLSDHRRLYVSGTASIEPAGATVHVGDVSKQVELSMAVVEAILESRGAGWSDVTRAVAYFKDFADRPALDACCRQRNLPPLPIAVAHSDICRDDLLFEIEVDAVTT